MSINQVQEVNDIEVDPSNPEIIYAATDDGLYQSIDGGGFWGKLEFERAGSVAVHPTNSEVIYVGTRPTGEWNDETGHETDGAVYKSTDGGEDWTELGVLDGYIRSITPDPSFSGIVYVATDRGVYIYKASGDVTPPATPKDVQAELQDTTATINWTANTENDLEGYKVYYGISPGAYGTSIDVKKETSHTITGLSQDTGYYIAVSAYDTSRNESPPSKEIKLVVGEVLPALSFMMQLSRGINMVSLPLKPSKSYTARSFAEKLNATFIIEYDSTTGEFFSFLPSVATTDGFIIQGGKGYIVNVQSELDVTFTGTGWWTSEAPSVVDVKSDGVWAFVVGGIVSEDVVLPGHPVTVQVTNINTGASVKTLVGSAGPGRFSAAFVDFSREDVVHIGDLIEISLLDSSGKLLGVHISEINLENIRDASLTVRLTKDDFIPSQTKLEQNFPNPFNPETWIPYQLAESANVVIRIYDVGGRMIQKLDTGWKPAGNYRDRGRAVYWDGRNEAGERVASGVYLYVMEAGNFRATKRMFLLK